MTFKNRHKIAGPVEAISWESRYPESPPWISGPPPYLEIGTSVELLDLYCEQGGYTTATILTDEARIKIGFFGQSHALIPDTDSFVEFPQEIDACKIGKLHRVGASSSQLMSKTSTGIVLDTVNSGDIVMLLKILPWEVSPSSQHWRTGLTQRRGYAFEVIYHEMIGVIGNNEWVHLHQLTEEEANAAT